jgi:hypothetical protein
VKLYVAISHHGYGHLAQTAPVLEALHGLDPDIRFTVRTALPPDVLAPRLAVPFEHIAAASDCNLVMHDAVRVDVPASLDAYRAFHAGWARRVEDEARQLEALRVDAVLANVGYLPLAAAQRAGMPCAALCSLNWADIFRHYLGHADQAAAILDAMLAAYAGARVFFRPEPAMPMPDLPNTVAVPPIARPGRERRADLRARLGLADGVRLVLVGMGGVPYRPPVESWPRHEHLAYLAPDAWQADRPDVFPFGVAGMPFPDLLASCDALVAKAGYGTYVEAAAAGVPVLFVGRPDWPESPWLNGWLTGHARALEIEETALIWGSLATPLDRLWALPAKPLVAGGGASVTARYLHAALS